MKILVAGDFCDKLRVSTEISKRNYNSLFSSIVPITNCHDYSIVNFEFPIVRTKGSPIKKCGPNLIGQLASVEAILYAGFNVATLANNHILDQGPECALETQKELIEKGIKTVGLGGGNLPSRETILYLKTEQERVAIINCCEHEFSVTSANEIGANPIDPISIYSQIKEARRNATYVIVITHGGHEHFNLPSPRMKTLYRFFIDTGADTVVNHHQHCYSGYEIYKGKPIFYGLGNFLFDHASFRNNFWNEGYLVSLDLSGGDLGYKLIPYTQCNSIPSVELMDEIEEDKFKKNIQSLNSIISNDTKLQQTIEAYYAKCAKFELDNLEPYQGRVFAKLMRMGFLPRWIKGQKISTILNHIDCESHRDKLIYALTKQNR